MGDKAFMLYQVVRDGRLLTFWAFRVGFYQLFWSFRLGAYSRWSLINVLGFQSERLCEMSAD